MAVLNFGNDGMNSDSPEVTVPGEGGQYFFINETEHTITGIFGAGGDLSFTSDGLTQIPGTDRYQFTMEGRSVLPMTVLNASDDPRTFGFNLTNDRAMSTHGTPLGGRTGRNGHGDQRFFIAEGT